jgi:hypothetical protein
LFTDTDPVTHNVGNILMTAPGSIWVNANFEFLNTGAQSVVSCYIVINGLQSNTTSTTIAGQALSRVGYAKLSTQSSVYCGVTGNIPIEIGVSCPYPGAVWFTYYDLFGVGNLP